MALIISYKGLIRKKDPTNDLIFKKLLQYYCAKFKTSL